jgi:hypothetical protein
MAKDFLQLHIQLGQSTIADCAATGHVNSVALAARLNGTALDNPLIFPPQD